MNRTSSLHQRAGRSGPVLAVVVAAALAFAACGSDSSSSSSVATTVATSPTSQPQSTEPAPTEPTTPPVTEPAVDLAALVQPIIDASLEPGALDWNCCGVDIPATSVRLGVHVDGYDDVLLASGSRLDGTPALATDPFPGDSLGHGLVRQATLALIADGTIDPAATIDQWLPEQPNADRVTVQMLLDDTHGWTTSAQDDFIVPNLLADLARTWTLAETLDLAAAQPPVAEPGTFDHTNGGNTIGMIALAYVLEQVTGSSLADIVRDQVTAPLGLSDTFLSVGSDDPADLQWGMFVSARRDRRDRSPGSVAGGVPHHRPAVQRSDHDGSRPPRARSGVGHGAVPGRHFVRPRRTSRRPPGSTRTASWTAISGRWNPVHRLLPVRVLRRGHHAIGDRSTAERHRQRPARLHLSRRHLRSCCSTTARSTRRRPTFARSPTRSTTRSPRRCRPDSGLSAAQFSDMGRTDRLEMLVERPIMRRSVTRTALVSHAQTLRPNRDTR